MKKKLKDDNDFDNDLLHKHKNFIKIKRIKRLIFPNLK